MAVYIAGGALLIGLVIGALGLISRTWPFYSRTVDDPRQIAVDLFSSSLLGVGITFVLAAPAFWWWVNGSRERYLWIINGPAPYNRFGSGPLQLWIGVLLAAIGVVLFTLGAVLRQKMRSK